MSLKNRKNSCFSRKRIWNAGLAIYFYCVLGLAAQPAITVYNKNFAVVRDIVSLELKSGINDVSYSGVTAQLEPESVILRDPSGKVALSVLEQSYRGDPVDEERLLQLFEGQKIRFLKELDDGEVVVSGKIIRAPSTVMVKDQYGSLQQKSLQPIVEIDKEVQVGLPGLPLFPSLGDDSVLQPTLSWKLFADKKAQFGAQLSYLTNGMSWKSDYNLVLPEKGDAVTFTGWVSIENSTGKTFEEAKIKLIAGEVSKVEPVGSNDSVRYKMPVEPTITFAQAPAIKEKKFDEFHMYTLPLATTLRDRETKQVEFVRAESVQTKRLYVYDGFKVSYYGRLNDNQNYGKNTQPDVAVYRELENKEENGLGIPLPAGRVRFYRMDNDGQLEFTGENTIDHTPKNETIRVYLGNAFDLVGERTRKDFFKHPSRNSIRESFEVEIRNRSEETVTVQVVEHLYRWSNWKIESSSHEFEKADAQTIQFPVTVEPDGTQVVTYTVRYTW